MMKRKLLYFGLVALILSACGSQSGTQTETPVDTAVDTAETSAGTEEEDETTETPSDVTQTLYFTKGVYFNYKEGATNRDYFYVFDDEGSGYAEDGNDGAGLPFSCEQKDGKVVFSFGGADLVSTQELVVKSVENGIITGEMDGSAQVFELIPDVDPDSFDSRNYVAAANGSEEAIYEDPNGWSVRYPASDFEINTQAPITTFVYIGESAGTNMITATYVVSDDAETYINEMAESWGGVEVTKITFPGTEDVDGFKISIPSAEEGSGLYEMAIARDYMGGSLIFEVTGHDEGPIADELTAIIDSIVFISYEE